MLKLVALVALFAGFCWVGTHLQLGQHTLFGHLRAIAQTKESQELFDGTRASARRSSTTCAAASPVFPPRTRRSRPRSRSRRPTTRPSTRPHDKVEQSKGELAKPTRFAKPQAKPDSAKPESTKPDSAKPDKSKRGLAQETLTPSERRHLRRVISAAEGASARQ